MHARARMVAAWLLATACSGEEALDLDALMDPAACTSCHPNHAAEWAVSTHALASDNPVFRAMNALGQRETGGALGDACVRCHAPVAVWTGATTDGLDLDSVPAALQGVTCFACHAVERIEDDHNNGLVFSRDLVMRGGIRRPVDTPAHPSAWSPLVDGRRWDSAGLCGSCHDVVTPAGVAAERTYVEWAKTIFGQTEPGRMLTCGQCHLPGRDAPVAFEPTGPVRRHRDHTMVGVGVPLDREADALVAQVRAELNPALLAEVCWVAPIGAAMVRFETVIVGHSFPSGAAHHRRAWAEVVIERGGQEVLRTGTIPEGRAVTAAAADDRDLWVLRDRLLDADGQETSMLWRAASFETDLLTGPVTTDPSSPTFDHGKAKLLPVPGGPPDRISVAVHLRPIGLEVLDELEREGLVDASLRARVPTYTLADTQVVWRREDGVECATTSTVTSTR